MPCIFQLFSIIPWNVFVSGGGGRCFVYLILCQAENMNAVAGASFPELGDKQNIWTGVT